MTLMIPKVSLTAQQLHFTSCQFGMNRGDGFQTRSMSSGISPVEKMKINELGGYKIPRNLEEKPTRQELNDLYPIAYRHDYLDSGKLMVTRSTYIGIDYSNRPNNYFCHGLLFEPLPDQLWPVDLYEWEGWKSKLDEGEDVEQDNYELPQLSLEPDQSAFGFDELQEFLAEVGGRDELLSKMLQAVFLRRAQDNVKRSLVIREDMLNNSLFWIACIQKSFPPSLQQEISCSSYQFDPAKIVAVNVVYGETDFLFGEQERNFVYYLFDLIDNIFSEVGDDFSEYAVTITDWMLHKPKKLQSFHLFASQFKQLSLGEQMVKLLRLFRLSQDESLALESYELLALLEFINQHTKKDDFGNILDIVVGFIEQLDGTTDPQDIKKIALFFINAADKGKEGVTLAAYQQLLKLSSAVIVDKNFTNEELQDLYMKARSTCNNFDVEYSELFLSQHIVTLTKQLRRLDDVGLSNAIGQIIAAVSFSSNQDCILNDQRLVLFVSNSLIVKRANMSNLDWLFDHFKHDPESVSTLCCYVCQVLQRLLDKEGCTAQEYHKWTTEFSNYLIAFLNDNKQLDYFELINSLKSNRQCWDLLSTDWRNRIDKQRDKLAFQDNYYDQILLISSEFSKCYRLFFAETFWGLLSIKQQLEQARAWLNSTHLDYFNDPLLSMVLQKASEDISLKPNDERSDTLVDCIKDKLNNSSIELAPDRIVLRKAVLDACDDGSYLKCQFSGDLAKILTGADKKLYNDFISQYLPLMFNKASTPLHHKQLLDQLMLNQCSKDVVKQYKHQVDKSSVDPISSTAYAALQFWLSAESESEQLNQLRKDVISIFVARLSKIKDKDLNALHIKLYRQKNMEPATLMHLELLMDQIEARKNTWLKKTWRSATFRVKKLLKIKGDEDV